MPTLVLSCEHAVCSVPEWHRERFKNNQDLLASYRGWDPGALNLAQAFAMKFRTPLTHGEVTRLLIDLDLGPNNPQRFNEHLEDLTEDQRRRMNERYHGAYYDALRQRIRSGLAVSPPVVHLSVHTFSPESDLAPPDADIALLYEAARPDETLLGGTWIASMRAAAPDLRIADNPPGSSGEIIHVMRQEYNAGSYLGLRLEVCQSFFLNGSPWRWDKLKKMLLSTFDET